MTNVREYVTPVAMRAARGCLNWSQIELARVADISRSTVVDIENENEIASDDMLWRIYNTFVRYGVHLGKNGISWE